MEGLIYRTSRKVIIIKGKGNILKEILSYTGGDLYVLKGTRYLTPKDDISYTRTQVIVFQGPTYRTQERVVLQVTSYRTSRDVQGTKLSCSEGRVIMFHERT